MNKKPQRNDVRAPTTQPDFAPSGTLAADGEFPLSASNGVTAPEPHAAHDVLQAAMAPREAAGPDDSASVAAPAVDAVANAPQEDGPEVTAPAVAADKKQGKMQGKKQGKKSGTATAHDAADAAKPAKKARASEETEVTAKAPPKPTKDKFVKCTFSLPESEMLVLDGLKKTHQANGAALKKSQVLRAALLALADIDAERLAQLVAQLPVEQVASKKKK
jgi:hypothetical protein